jgi:hypothetical protein
MIELLYGQSNANRDDIPRETVREPRSNHEDVIIIDDEDHTLREEEIDRHFGRDALPAIEQVDYQTTLSFQFKVNEEIQHMPVSIGVRIRGRNVLEGIRNLLSAGLAQPPLPSFLTDIQKTAANNFRVREEHIVIDE